MLLYDMNKQKTVLTLLFVIASAGNSIAETLLPPPLPEGTPQEMEGFNSRTLYNSYRNAVFKDIKDASQESLNRISSQFFDFGTVNKVARHGVSFRYYPVVQTSEGEEGLGQIYHSCDRKKKFCDWVMKVVTVPIISASEWTYANFDAVTAVSNLKARDIEPDDSISQLGFLMKLPSPKPYILANAKKQLYYGKDCPSFVSILGSNYYGQERGKYLIDISTTDKKDITPKHVKNAEFEISILESPDKLEIYYAQPIIELKFSSETGNEIGNKLFESIKDCPNKADAEL